MTKLVRWNPWQLADEMHRERNLHERVSRELRAPAPTRAMARPALDVLETDDGLAIRVNLPGLSGDDVNVEVEDQVLTISGEISDAIDEENERYTHRERYYGTFKRSLRLGDQIDVENIAATFENGVLALTLPALPEAQPKQIAVQTA